MVRVACGRKKRKTLILAEEGRDEIQWRESTP